MRLDDLTGRLGLALMFAVALVALPAQAIQFTPTSTSRLHTVAAGEGGMEWDTGGPSANGSVVYTSGTGMLDFDAEVDTLNYFDPSGTCTTDVGSNCSHTFTTSLDFAVDAMLLGVTVGPTSFGVTDIILNLGSTGGTDISLTDPADGDAVLFTASWAAGFLDGSPTPGLQVFATYNDGSFFGTAGLLADPTILGIALVDTGLPYSDLFNSGGSGNVLFDLGELILTDFSPDLNTIAADLISGAITSLPDLSGEAQGEVFRAAAGSFVVPEPATALLLSLGIAGLAVAGRPRSA
jgi:hypothetical protein